MIALFTACLADHLESAMVTVSITAQVYLVI